MFLTSKLILLGLLSASANLVGAIDIYLYDAKHSCSGATFIYTNVNPNTQLDITATIATTTIVSAFAPSRESGISSYAAIATATAVTLPPETAINPNAQPIGSFSGAGYSFYNKRRTTAGGLFNCPTESPTYRGIRRPDRLELADSTKYNITRLTDAERLELRSTVTTKVTAAKIPTKFDHFKI
ncbi:hypothetical protein VTL71DRAFT_14457 [Oculimacula yallundae]|uniref:Uncharacterized protein n=1 Tax=Oculimacula yallundae TaxID=86028 RepID=A0ABR4CIN3_9HELO